MTLPFFRSAISDFEVDPSLPGLSPHPSRPAHAPLGDWQGVYLVTPDGKRLGSTRSYEGPVVYRTLAGAMGRFEPGAATKQAADDAALRALARTTAFDGLALRSYDRDLHADASGKPQPGPNFNTDHAWFTPDESAQLVPAKHEVGATAQVPRALVERLARTTFIDIVNGLNFTQDLSFTAAFRKGDVQQAELTSTVTAVDGDRVTVRFDGHTRCTSTRIHPPRVLATQVLGHATWDAKARRFTKFELVALGTRSGNSTDMHSIDDRGKDLGPAGIGFFLELTGDTEIDRLPPLLLKDYGWPAATVAAAQHRR